ncbi:MAG: prepilin-type N-terminal cleavage/methylation domain-containing protein [Candidatus Eisenbacteria bacterium]|uniref:Prepilin-type N-terminal cleavage/methylation domain-containing protein n=1 Tax=Eiseniibacteriota bacterium TaxID=2212470 RepID=A0A9D6L8A0_UNCEI|nr:prepilin-type N-terminal cleavage/methylation domain-containing protein [Candidatus Eisenbacteria bacterium]MBI3538742.1 prepilin-type N-terminal cleavage/methylation domain-containing protein [Candidatus Eisenbacteria bacterium]
MKPVQTGFTLVELAITLVVMGLLFAFAIPAFQNISASYQLKGATQNIAAQLRMAREKAIATGSGQPIHFTANFMNCDYHIHYPSGFVVPLGKLPLGITYYSVGIVPTMNSDGTCNTSGSVVLQDRRGNRDTVSVNVSGMVLAK